jgi:hypothetical protein
VGFLRDSKRLNVMLTRAMNGLVVVGHEETLKRDEKWGAWINWIRGKKLIVGIYLFSKAMKSGLVIYREIFHEDLFFLCKRAKYFVRCTYVFLFPAQRSNDAKREIQRPNWPTESCA